MIIANDYRIEYDEKAQAYRVKGRQAAYCPDCRHLLSGYDTRKRTVLGNDGTAFNFILRRLRCPHCGRMHLEIPDFIAPHKHYSAEVIQQALSQNQSFCPADDSTIRRWRRKK